MSMSVLLLLQQLKVCVCVCVYGERKREKSVSVIPENLRTSTELRKFLQARTESIKYGINVRNYSQMLRKARQFAKLTNKKTALFF